MVQWSGVFFSDSKTGSHSVVHGAVLEDNCRVGEGSTILDGAVVGSEAYVAPGSLVLSGQRIGAKQVCKELYNVLKVTLVLGWFSCQACA